MDETSAALTDDLDAQSPVRELARSQRRVLGVLVEKGFTTPEYYPLTLKAVTTGCNQKSNRDPVTNYSEDAIEEALDELRTLGLVAVVHTESGRTERFRHFIRKRYPFTEPQLAVVTELLLRGRQQLGELRSRASRMVPIDSLEDLRDHLQGLLVDGFVRASGSLDRRGVEVDHNFYPTGEAGAFEPDASMPEDSKAHRPQSTATLSATTRPSSDLDALRDELNDLKARVSKLADELADLKRSLGV